MYIFLAVFVIAKLFILNELPIPNCTRFYYFQKIILIIQTTYS